MVSRVVPSRLATPTQADSAIEAFILEGSNDYFGFTFAADTYDNMTRAMHSTPYPNDHCFLALPPLTGGGDQLTIIFNINLPSGFSALPVSFTSESSIAFVDFKMQPNNYSNDSYDYSLNSAAPPALFHAATYPAYPSGSGTELHTSYASRRRLSAARKTSPDDLIPLDAPTQTRRYITPSLTSRKSVPMYFSKGRNSDQLMPEDEEDELTEEPPASNATDQEKIEWKRRQNTLAARRSRTRKMMKVQRLEDTVERLTKEKEIWRTRALTLKQLLHSHGIICPDFRD